MQRTTSRGRLRCWGFIFEAVICLYTAYKSHQEQLRFHKTSTNWQNMNKNNRIKQFLWLIATSSWFSPWKSIKKNQISQNWACWICHWWPIFFPPWDLNLPQFEQWLVKLNHPIYLKKTARSRRWWQLLRQLFRRVPGRFQASVLTGGVRKVWYVDVWQR